MKQYRVDLKFNKIRYTYTKRKEPEIDGYVYQVKDNTTGETWRTLIYDDIKDWCLCLPGKDRATFERQHCV